MLVDEKPNRTIIYIGSNDITKSNYHTIKPDELAKGILDKGLKFMYYGMRKIAISSIFERSNNDLNNVIKRLKSR